MHRLESKVDSRQNPVSKVIRAIRMVVSTLENELRKTVKREILTKVLDEKSEPSFGQ